MFDLLGALSFITEALFPAKVPALLLLGIVSSDAFYGSFAKSGFNFKPYGVTSVSVKCEENNLLYRSMKVDYESNLFQLAYQSIFAAMSFRYSGNGITRDQFANKGYCLYLFELLPTTDGTQLYPTKKGLLKVKIGYKLKFCSHFKSFSSFIILGRNSIQDKYYSSIKLDQYWNIQYCSKH